MKQDDIHESLKCTEAELARLRAELDAMRAELVEWHKLLESIANLLRGIPAQLTRYTYLHLAGHG